MISTLEDCFGPYLSLISYNVVQLRISYVGTYLGRYLYARNVREISTDSVLNEV
jgi:hypothetical protein